MFTFFKPSLLFHHRPSTISSYFFHTPLSPLVFHTTSPLPPPIPHHLYIRDLRVHTLSAICNITDELNLSVISLELVLYFLLCVSSDIETNSFHMIQVAHINIEFKIKMNDLLSDTLILMFVHQGCLLSMLLHNIVAVVLASFINADKRIKGNRRPWD